MPGSGQRASPPARETLIACTFAGALTCLVAFVGVTQPYRNGPPIRSDGAGYHVWVYGLLAGDLSFCRFEPLVGPTGSFVAKDEARGVCALKYPPGVGAFQLPFVAPWAAGTTATAFSPGAHRTVLALGSALLLVTLCFGYLSLRRLGVGLWTSLLSLAAFTFGTGLFHYATYDASFSHVYSACGIAFATWLVLCGRDRGWTPHLLLLFGLTVFWLFTVRATNGAITLAVAALPFCFADAGRLRVAGAWAAGTACALAMQLAYNDYAQGFITLSSYGPIGFVSFGAHFLDVLASYERGLFTYYPVFLLTLVFAAFARPRALSLAFGALVGLFALVYGSWNSWYLGGGMGHRGFVELAPLGALVLGCGLQRLDRTGRAFATFLLAVCVYVTVSIMLGYWEGTVPFAGATREVFAAHVLP